MPADVLAALERSRRVLKLSDVDRPDDYYRDKLLLVARSGGIVLGHTAWTQHPAYALWDETVVEPEWQGRGVGGALMEQRLRCSQGAVFGATAPDNDAMRRLLYRLGLRCTKTLFHAYGPGKDALLYERTR